MLGSYPGSAAVCKTGTPEGAGQQGDYDFYTSSFGRVEPQIVNDTLFLDSLRLFQWLWVECNAHNLNRYTSDRLVRAAASTVHSILWQRHRTAFLVNVYILLWYENYQFAIFKNSYLMPVDPSVLSGSMNL